MKQRCGLCGNGCHNQVVGKAELAPSSTRECATDDLQVHNALVAWPQEARHYGDKLATGLAVACWIMQDTKRL